MVSISRSSDATLLKVFQRAAAEIGPLEHFGPTSKVLFDGFLPVADVYAKMEQAGVVAYTVKLGDGPDDVTFFCLREEEVIIAFNQALRIVIGLK
jgi:hypothetical protein